jgi:hypothetical protein
MSETTRITIPLRRLMIVLVAVLGALCLAGVVAEYARYALQSKSAVVDYFSLTEEQNIPTWWSSFLLATCSVVLALIASTKRRAPGQFKAHWIALAAIFCYLSIDELVEIHEWLNNIKALGNLHGIIYYGWVIPAGAIVVVFALSYLKFLFHLPSRSRNEIALAGVVYVAGALGIELVLGLWTDRHGELNFTWAMIGLIEEALEMLGASLFLVALLRYWGASSPEIRIDVR